MSLKMETYLKFNETFPGFGGFIPWFLADEKEIQPTADWVNRVPGLDNGYNFIKDLKARAEIGIVNFFGPFMDSWTSWKRATIKGTEHLPRVGRTG